jgi:hypothetical protein
MTDDERRARAFSAWAESTRGRLPWLAETFSAGWQARDADVAAADALADDLAGLLNHYERHTTHRCEIDRDAWESLAAYRAARTTPAAPEGS